MDGSGLGNLTSAHPQLAPTSPVSSYLSQNCDDTLFAADVMTRNLVKSTAHAQLASAKPNKAGMHQMGSESVTAEIQSRRSIHHR